MTNMPMPSPLQMVWCWKVWFEQMSSPCLQSAPVCSFLVQRQLINGVAGSLIQAPDFKNKQDSVRLDLVAMAKHVASYEPEFVLKVGISFFSSGEQF